MDYRHGGDIYGENRIAFDFSVNTNPLGMPNSVREAVMEQTHTWSRYPDSRCRKLRKRLAETYNEEQKIDFSPEDFLCGNGAADLLYSLIFALRPKKALLSAPSFGEYEAALLAADCRVETIYLEEKNGFFMDFAGEELEHILSGELDMVILGNPNNPTGRAIFTENIKEWASVCLERNIFLVVDECFVSFLKDEKQYSAVSLLSDFPNLLILNAFTKAYAMAGLRLGYVICKNKEVLMRMEGCRQPWSVSAPAEAAGLKALHETAFLHKTRRLVEAEREFLSMGLKSLSFTVFLSQVNYLLFKRNDSVDYYERCARQGVLIRSCESFAGLDNRFYRVAVKTREENEVLLKVLAKAQEGRTENG